MTAGKVVSCVRPRAAVRPHVAPASAASARLGNRLEMLWGYTADDCTELQVYGSSVRTDQERSAKPSDHRVRPSKLSHPSSSLKFFVFDASYKFSSHGSGSHECALARSRGRTGRGGEGARFRPARPRPVHVLRSSVSTLLVALFGLTPLSCDVVTVRPLKETGRTAPQGNASMRAFDPDAYVSESWPKRVLPAIEAGAGELRPVLDSLTQPGGPRFALARARGRVMSVESRGRERGVVLDLEPPDGKSDVWIQLGGPAGIDGVAMRDGSGVISFDQFTNQIQFAKVASSLSRFVEAEVVKPVLPVLKPGTLLTATGVVFRMAGSGEPGFALAPASLALGGAPE